MAKSDNGYTTPTLHWLATTLCRDDYGMAHTANLGVGWFALLCLPKWDGGQCLFRCRVNCAGRECLGWCEVSADKAAGRAC